jgi:hypothetical protein
MKKIIYSLFLILFTIAIQAQDVAYYKVTTMRAAPGKLLDLIEILKEDMAKHEQFGMQQPYLMRHSQGDQWDLLMIYPIGNTMGNYMTDSEIGQRRMSRTQDQTHGSEFFNFISFQEEQIIKGPSIDEFNRRFRTFNYYHVEIFQALAGKQTELREQREMENVYLKELNRDENFIFTKVFGGEADQFTIGFYNDIKHYAAAGDIAFEVEDLAAKKAGFESVNTIGSYLRSLLLEHHDTLAGAVRVN